MRIFNILLASAAMAAAAAATPAFAQDSTFTGPRIEANVGYDSVHADDHVAATPNSIDAARLGIAAGYDVGIGKVVTIGVEGGIGWALGDGRSYTSGATTVTADTGRDIDVSLRVGARVAPRTLVYAKGGWANSEFHGTVKTGATSVSARSDEDGWRIGLGVEQMLGEHVYAKAEYRYTDYGDDVTRHQALVGIGYRF
ncbi:porin family protein [Sphingomonas oligophenolica]|uniref:Porin family protein n=1 Tax=Sphingomonas oligophenolica TaxID=301154 RepID=A0ABU9YB82_9SPHN